MEIIIKRWHVITLLMVMLIVPKLKAQENAVEIDPGNIEQNQVCLKCHGHSNYFFFNEGLDRNEKERMNPYFIIDSSLYYVSNHKYSLCVDCHSYEYETFPHSGQLRMEPKFGCLDCHGGDETYAKYNFEQIDEEFRKSVHASKHSDEFTCSMCHNPHTYKINARTNENMAEFIEYDNEICLSCHANISKYQLLTTKENPNILETHSWLPNQVLHFKKVRCLECHAAINNDILVAHDILPKDKAIKRCVECHSSNSRLLASLYKYQFSNKRSLIGFSNEEMLGESYVIGANRNYYLNVISIGLFGLVLLGLCIHAVLRIIIKH